MKKFNIHFFILLNILITIVLADSIIFFTGLNYMISVFIGLLLDCTCIGILIKRKKIGISIDFNKIDILFYIGLAIITVFTIIYPDSFWDTKSYHIYLQQNPFVNKINFDFFAGRNLNSFQFPIADRVYYLFRYILGYRLGTIIGYYLIVVLYYQVKRIFSGLQIFNKIHANVIGLLSIIPISLFVIIEQLGTYYIDNFSLVLLLEIFYISFFTKDIFKEKIKLYFVAIIVGFAVCIKISNLVLLFPFILYLLIVNYKDIKNIKIYDFALLIFVFFATFLPYMIDNICQTGSPIFPYYNNVFKSEYFQNINWQDNTFGYKTLKELIFWPLYTFIYPLRAYNYGVVDRAWYFGYIVAIFYLFIYFFNIIRIKISNYKFNILKKLDNKSETIETNSNNRADNKMLQISILLIVEYLLWSKFLVGYTRYASIIPVIATIFIVSLTVKMINEKRVIFTLILSSMIYVSIILTLKQYMEYKPSIIKTYINNGKYAAENEFKNNAKYLLKDKISNSIDIDGVWASVRDDSETPTILRKDDPIYDIETWATISNDLTKDMYYDKVKNNKIYVPLNYTLLSEKLSLLTKNKFQILPNITTYKDINFLTYNDVLYVAEVKYNENLISNEQYILNLKNNIVEKTISDNKKYKFNAYVVLSPQFKYSFIDGVDVELYVKQGENLLVIDKKHINKEMNFVYFSYESEVNSSYDKVGIKILDNENQDKKDDSVLAILSEIES